MDWPKELLEIFDDPLLADVKLKPQPMTADDRKVQKLQEVADWIAAHGKEPQANGDLAEKMMCRALAALRRDKDQLKSYDTSNIL